MSGPKDSDFSSLRIEREPEAAPKKHGKPRRQAPRIVGPLVTLAILGVAAWFVWPMVAPKLESWRAPTVETSIVVRTRAGGANEITIAAGYVVARTRAALAAKVPGKLVELNVDSGSLVNKGDVIARIDPSGFEAQRDRALARWEQMKAEVVAAEVRVGISKKAVTRVDRSIEQAQASEQESQIDIIEAERVLALENRLQERGASTEDAVKRASSALARLRATLTWQKAGIQALLAAQDSTVAEVRGAEARVQVAAQQVLEAEAGLRAAATDLADCAIRAPFSGIVLRKEAEVGEIVVPALAGGGSSRGAVVTMADTASLELEVDVFERDIGEIKDGAPCVITLNAWTGVSFAAHVRQKMPTADRTKGTVQVKVAFDVPDARVMPELGGKATFLRQREVVAAPAEVQVLANALTERDGQRGVFALERGRVRFVPLELGERRNDRVVVRRGLEGGELVIVNPELALSDGLLVQTKDP